MNIYIYIHHTYIHKKYIYICIIEFQSYYSLIKAIRFKTEKREKFEKQRD